MAWGSVNVPGGSTQGADGKSAYQIAVDNGFTGTEAQWLASLKGETGNTGATGATGADGATGPAGPGLPAGGTAGQVPVKMDETDYNTQWKTLTATDINALPKNNPVSTGCLTADHINVESIKSPGTAIGFGAYASLDGLCIGKSSAAISSSDSTVISVTGVTYDGRYCTVSVDTTKSVYTRFMSALNSAVNEMGAISKVGMGIVWHRSTYYDIYESYTANVYLNEYDSEAGTVKLMTGLSNLESTVTDIKYIFIATTDGYSNYPRHYAIGDSNLLCTGSTSAAGSESFAIGTHNNIFSTATIGIGSGLSTNDSTSSGYDKIKIILGKFNNTQISTSDVVIVGGGSSTARANCFRITTSGVYANGNYNATGADYAEQFEWMDANPTDEDRIGRFVTLDGEKIRLAGPEDDFILGIISGNPSVVGDTYDDQWQGMYETDIFGRFLYEDVLIPAEYDEEGNVISEEHMETQLKVNPAYNSSEKYVPRSERREWAVVGMMGKLTVIDDGSCEVNGWCTAGESGIAVKSDSRTRYRVMSRIDETHVRVLIL